jgi:DNA-binding MarR family transcriptional regulator
MHSWEYSWRADVDFGMNVFDSLVRGETRLWNHLNAVVRDEHGMPLSDLVAVRAIAERDGDGRVDDLRTDLGVTVGAASKLVDRLVRAAAVDRLPHPTDRRSSLLRLTPRGRELARSTSEAIDDELAAIFADEDPADLAVVAGVLGRLAARWERSGEAVR